MTNHRSSPDQNLAIRLPLALLILSLASMHYFCDVYIDTTVGGCCPQVSGREARVDYFSPAEFLCWQGSGPMSIAILLAIGAVLVSKAVTSRYVIESRLIATFLMGLRIYGRLMALFSIGLLALVLYAYTHFEFFI